jgi:hypothetical protein
MFLTILLLASTIIGIVLSIKTERITSILLTLGLVAGLLLALFPVKELEIPGVYFYMLSLIAVFIYGFTRRGMSIIPRLILLLLPASMFIFWLWTENHWHGNTHFLLGLTVLLSFLGLFYKRDLRREWGLLLIIFMDAVTLIIENLLKQLS